MWQYRPTEELYHYGIQGMKWGVRKRQRSADSAEVKQIRKKRIKEMSNKDLQTANKRLQLEKNYKDLSKRKNYVKLVAGTFIAGGATLAAITKAVGQYKQFGVDVSGAATKALGSIGNWVFKDLGRIM